ncbi:MAG TPA: hypothetical protein VFY39_01655 [Gammaproteobacteria bacterium]|nr:hypothetical protein [Gammaproteobacteria bacterium]
MGRVNERAAARLTRLGAPALLAAAALLLAASPGRAQNAGNRPARHTPSSDLTEAPPPPRILEQERAKPQAPASAGARRSSGAFDNGAVPNPLAPGSAPFQARLAPPTPGRDDDLDEIIVVGRNDGSHLPDLGGKLRAEREAQLGQGRIEFTLLPLYEGTSLTEERNVSLFGNRPMQRVGYINVFRFRFGARSKE